jgi:hypothetical protein
MFLVFANGGSSAVSQTMLATVPDDGTIHLTFADGSAVGSPTPPGPTIPAGTYAIQVNDDSELDDIHITGPGVDMSSGVVADLQTTWTVTFQPGSSYHYTSDAQANLGGYFQTSGTSSGASTPSSSSSSSSSTGSTASGSSSSTNAASSAASSTSTSGSKSTALLGTLEAGAGPAGTLRLDEARKVVSRLKPGHYKVVVADRSAKEGFVFTHAGHSISLSGINSVGTRTVTVTFTPGRWSFSSIGTPRLTTSFTVAT